MEKVLDKEQLESYEKIKSMQEQLSQLQVEYWHSYSNLETVQFWVIFLLFFVAPLVALYFLIDRKKIFLIGFYGFNIHVWFSYIDIWGYKNGLWGYPFELIPFLPGNLSLDAALIPVLFMLVYQWTLNNNKNFYLYTFGLSVFLSFVFKPLLTLHHYFELHKGVNFFHLLLAYCVIFLISKMITNIFIKMKK
ncbi:CBO0543 family protein [Alkalihalobacterium alkalinitrilicum]|uniref:CBO0543 family protein n=1 Tax=Alkalihalobacterium alkalinitrilicum TaxID=427920 RepID=UPI0009959860|nr:CBO0543 family protein [Alkalihalobacterium alkalinitrilicum]